MIYEQYIMIAEAESIILKERIILLINKYRRFVAWATQGPHCGQMGDYFNRAREKTIGFSNGNEETGY